MSTKDYIDIVFDGPPAHESGRFIEVENPEGASIRVGEWVEREDGYWALRIPQPTPVDDAVEWEEGWSVESPLDGQTYYYLESPWRNRLRGPMLLDWGYEATERVKHTVRRVRRRPVGEWEAAE